MIQNSLITSLLVCASAREREAGYETPEVKAVRAHVDRIRSEGTPR